MSETTNFNSYDSADALRAKRLRRPFNFSATNATTSQSACKSDGAKKSPFPVSVAAPGSWLRIAWAHWMVSVSSSFFGGAFLMAFSNASLIPLVRSTCINASSKTISISSSSKAQAFGIYPGGNTNGFGLDFLCERMRAACFAALVFLLNLTIPVELPSRWRQCRIHPRCW